MIGENWHNDEIWRNLIAGTLVSDLRETFGQGLEIYILEKDGNANAIDLFIKRENLAMGFNARYNMRIDLMTGRAGHNPIQAGDSRYDVFLERLDSLLEKYGIVAGIMDWREFNDFKI